jgi:hypothetical protein
VFLYDEQKRGTWSDSEAERLCRAVHKFARTRAHAFDESLMEKANIQMRLLEALKKEFRLTRVLWRQIFDQVAGVDELNMSTLRLENGGLYYSGSLIIYYMYLYLLYRYFVHTSVFLLK